MKRALTQAHQRAVRSSLFPLKRLRLLRGMKQSHLAELLGVTQTTVSRWESGTLAMPEASMAAARQILVAPPNPSQDSALKRLVEHSSLKVHLVCDRTHRLFAASPSRRTEWRVDAGDLFGKTMLVFASQEILAAESALGDRGWFDNDVASMIVETGPNRSDIVPIHPSRILWERVTLSDGTPGRVVTTIA